MQGSFAKPFLCLTQFDVRACENPLIVGFVAMTYNEPAEELVTTDVDAMT